MLAMFTANREDNDNVEFKFIHVFAQIETCEKWTEMQTSLSKDKDALYQPSAPVVAPGKGRSIGNKKAKEARDAAPATERLYSCIEKCTTDAAAQAAKREELAAKRAKIAASRWATVIKK
jgi:uncharacterized protein YhaN